MYNEVLKLNKDKKIFHIADHAIIKDSFISSLSICLFYISFFCLIALAMTCYTLC